MAILQHETVESTSGFKKKIEESAMTMIFDNLQMSQYRHPIKSTVREVACNALDAIKERDAVIEILKGKAKEEDYFIRRDDPLYKDSNFDKDYYDLKWLSDEQDAIITYYSKETTGEKDYVSIKDYGVGLGGQRLEGYMNLGFSTKRNSKLNIGKFGIGAKAPLSTNVSSYRIISTYNGQRFIFDIYSHKVDSIVPKFNLDTGEKNDSVVWIVGQETLTDGTVHDIKYTVYYEKTTSKNSVEVIVETKKHHKQAYIEAAKSQLLYLKGVRLYVDEDGYTKEIDISSDIMYEDDKIILAENRQYSKPHIVLDGVTYGYIDFLELELENKVGNVGIKVDVDEVSVNPSRETVIWNDRTRDTIVNRFKEVVDIATSFVEAELKEVDFVQWLMKCTSTLAHTNGNSTLGRLSKLVDKSTISPAYPLDKSIKYQGMEKFFQGFKVRHIVKSYDSKAGKERVKRDEITSWSSIQFDHAYIQEDKTSHQKDLYLYSIANPASNDRWASKQSVLVLEPKELPADHKLNPKQATAYNERRDKVLAHLKKSGVLIYEDKAIPEDWKDKVEHMEKAEEKGVAYDAPVLSPAELREQNQETVFKRPHRGSYYDAQITFTIEEWKIASIASIDENPAVDKLVYGFGNDRAGLEFIYDFCKNSAFKKVEVISISKQNEKYYKDLKKSVYIKDLFKQIDYEKKSITVDPLIIAYNTTRLLQKKISTLKYLANYGIVDEEKRDAYLELKTYIQQHRHSTHDHQLQDELDIFLDKLVEFQLFVKQVEGNEKMISNKSAELFGSDAFEDSNVIDMAVYEKYKDLLAYSEPIHTLLNHVKPLVDSLSISEELETEIKGYVNYKLGNLD